MTSLTAPLVHFSIRHSRDLNIHRGASLSISNRFSIFKERLRHKEDRTDGSQQNERPSHGEEGIEPGHSTIINNLLENTTTNKLESHQFAIQIFIYFSVTTKRLAHDLESDLFPPRTVGASKQLSLRTKSSPL